MESKIAATNGTMKFNSLCAQLRESFASKPGAWSGVRTSFRSSRRWCSSKGNFWNVHAVWSACNRQKRVIGWSKSCYAWGTAMYWSFEEWASPAQKVINILNIPGSCAIYKDPLGVVLVAGAWNYPVNLTWAHLSVLLRREIVLR